VPAVLADFMPPRPSPELLRAIETTGLVGLIAAARQLVLLETTQSGVLTLIAGTETWALARELEDRGQRSITLSGWRVRYHAVPAAQLAAVLRLVEEGLRPRFSRYQLAEIAGPVAWSVLRDGARSQRTVLAGILGVSRQALVMRGQRASTRAAKRSDPV
jgi:hypothetical protein